MGLSGNKRLGDVLMCVGMVMIMIGTLLPVFRLNFPAYKFVYSAGAIVLLASRFVCRYKGSNMRLKRLKNMEVWSAIMFCVAAFFMFYDKTSSRDWLAFTLAGGVIQIYASLMIGRLSGIGKK